MPAAISDSVWMEEPSALVWEFTTCPSLCCDSQMPLRERSREEVGLDFGAGADPLTMFV